MRRTWNTISILLGIMFFVIPITTMIMVSHISTSQAIVNMDRGYQGNYLGGIRIASEVDKEELFGVICNTNEKIAIYQKYLGESTISSIYFRGDYVNIPMLEGRFFIEDDFYADNYVTVVGRNYTDQIYEENNISYIDINQIRFRVLGIMGIGSESVLDSRIIINGVVSDSLYVQNIYNLDFLKGNGENIIEECMENISKNLGVGVEIISMESGVLESYLPNVLFGRWYIGIMIGDILCVLLLSVEWARKKRREVAVRRLVGGTLINIAYDISKEYLLLLLIFCGSSFFICFIAYKQYYKYLNVGLYAVAFCIVGWILIMWGLLFKRTIMEDIK